jgi:hypothetical protein
VFVYMVDRIAHFGEGIAIGRRFHPYKYDMLGKTE